MTSNARPGQRMHHLVEALYPLCRSITGDGLRQTLRAVQARIPIELTEVASGTPALDWEVPREWNITGAAIETLDGEVLVDFRQTNLHVVNYSTPIDAVVSREELARHVHTLPDQPDLVPYRTGYYADDWGFCIADAVWRTMRDAQYRVRIDSTLAPGSLTYGELLIAGAEDGEVLICTHCCHPSLANDNLSGIAVAIELASWLRGRDNRLSYRFLFIPATIGSITWLSRNDEAVARIRHGLVLSCVGDRGRFHYKSSRRETAEIDRIVAHVLQARGQPHEILPFGPYGYDERQFCSPGYNLPVGCFMRSPNGTFPEYHTSGDDCAFVDPEALEESLDVLKEIVALADRDVLYTRVDGRGEPQLGRRGLYRAISGQQGHATSQTALLWVLNLADGQNSLLAMAQRAKLPFDQMAAAAALAVSADLIRPA